MSLEKTTILTGQPGHGCKVCVTGAGGFIASWLVKRLLERGYTVRGTVRQPNDAKNEHLRSLEGASDRLELVRADVLDYASLKAAFTGCDGVFHTASPVTDDLEKMIEPSMKGTKNVMYAASDSGVKRIIFTSTIGTIYLNPDHNHDEPVDETCWSDLEFCKKTKNWYCYAKTIAEQGAWEVAKERELDLIVINPVLVLGPLLHPSINASTNHVTKYLTGSAKTYVNAAQAYVHVKDVAEAHVKVYESPQAHGRYICAEGTTLHRGELCRLLVKLFPEYPITNKCRDEKNPPQKAYKFTNQKIKELGMEFTPVNQCIYETVISLQEKGLIPVLSKDLSTYSTNYEPLKILQTQTVL